MSLPDSWTNKPGAVPGYLESIRQAEAPERFSVRFLETLGYKSTNDRKIIGVLKSLGFLDTDGKPTGRYFAFLDPDRSEVVLAEGIREAYSDLFAVNKDAHKLTTEGAKNKLRTLYAGGKKDTVVGYIANTFTALVKCADFDAADAPARPQKSRVESDKSENSDAEEKVLPLERKPVVGKSNEATPHRLNIEGLQYHINIVLPESRDQAVYDALFRSLREHLG